MKGNIKNSIKWGLFILSVVLVALYVSQNYYQFILIQGESMSPTYHNLQLAIVNRHCESYTYSDIIAFRCETLNAVLVKRIAACPGDTLQIENGTLYVNGIPSTFYMETYFEFAGIAESELTLPDGQYFVIGDNVAESKDSRYEEIGCVGTQDILGSLLEF